MYEEHDRNQPCPPTKDQLHPIHRPIDDNRRRMKTRKMAYGSHFIDYISGACTSFANKWIEYISILARFISPHSAFLGKHNASLAELMRKVHIHTDAHCRISESTENTINNNEWNDHRLCVRRIIDRPVCLIRIDSFKEQSSDTYEHGVQFIDTE